MFIRSNYRFYYSLGLISNELTIFSIEQEKSMFRIRRQSLRWFSYTYKVDLIFRGQYLHCTFGSMVFGHLFLWSNVSLVFDPKVLRPQPWQKNIECMYVRCSKSRSLLGNLSLQNLQLLDVFRIYYILNNWLIYRLDSFIN